MTREASPPPRKNHRTTTRSPTLMRSKRRCPEARSCSPRARFCIAAEQTNLTVRARSSPRNIVQVGRASLKTTWRSHRKRSQRVFRNACASWWVIPSTRLSWAMSMACILSGCWQRQGLAKGLKLFNNDRLGFDGNSPKSDIDRLRDQRPKITINSHHSSGLSKCSLGALSSARKYLKKEAAYKNTPPRLVSKMVLRTWL